MDDSLDAIDDLRMAILEAWGELRKTAPSDAFRAGTATDRKLRESALRQIREDVLEGRPLESFLGLHLLLLVTMISFWRDVELQSDIYDPSLQ